MFSTLINKLTVSLLAKSFAAPPRLTASGNATWAKAYWAFNPARGLMVHTPPPAEMPKVKIPLVGVHQMITKTPQFEVKLRLKVPAARRAAAKCMCLAFSSVHKDALVRLVHFRVSRKAVHVALRPFVGVLDALVRPVFLDPIF